MRIQSIFDYPYGILAQSASQGAVTTGTMDASDEKVFMFGSLSAFNWLSGNKTITQIKLVPAAVTQGTGTTTLRVGFYGITPGSPPRDDGVLAESGTIALTGVAANTAYTVTLDAGRTVSRGERVGVVVEFSAFGTGPSIAHRTIIGRGGTGWTGISDYTAATWTTRTGLPTVTFICNDGTEIYFEGSGGGLLNLSGTDFNTGTTGTTLDSGDERGGLWVPKNTWDLWGMGFNTRVSAVTADFDLVLYRDTTELWSKAILGDELPAANSFYWTMVPFANAIRVNRGENIRFVMRPTTANSVRTSRLPFDTAAERKHWLGGDDSECDVTCTNRVDAGAWNTPSGADVNWPAAELLGVRLDPAPGGRGSMVVGSGRW